MKLNKHYKRVVNTPSHEAPLLHTTPPLSLPTSPSLAAGLPSAGIIADRPHGHRVDLIHREGGYGSVTTFIHPPIKGAHMIPLPIPLLPDRVLFSLPVLVCVVVLLGMLGWESCLRLTSLFLMVTILNSGSVEVRIISSCVKWILLCGSKCLPCTSPIQPLDGCNWLRSNKQVKSCGWDEFSQLVLIRFGRD